MVTALPLTKRAVATSETRAIPESNQKKKTRGEKGEKKIHPSFFRGVKGATPPNFPKGGGYRLMEHTHKGGKIAPCFGGARSPKRFSIMD